MPAQAKGTRARPRASAAVRYLDRGHASRRVTKRSAQPFYAGRKTPGRKVTHRVLREGQADAIQWRLWLARSRLVGRRAGSTTSLIARKRRRVRESLPKERDGLCL